MSMRVGIIGCGNIAPQYVKGLGMFPDDITLVACADMIEEKATAFANENNIEAKSVADLLSDESIDIIVNLTIPAAHSSVSLQVLGAGKHVYIEKPLALNRTDGKKVLDLAAENGLRVGCAPDTFLGAGGQTCRKVIDENRIGRPVAATAFLAIPGHESWHPNPSFYYSAGGGPMLDMGPYYLTALVNLLGPMKKVVAFTSRSRDERIAQHESIKGQKVPVTIDTHLAGTIEFESGAIATVITSFDVWKHNLPRIEIYGTEGSLSVPDPNIFGGDVTIWKPATKEWESVELLAGAEYLRGAGVADMARSIKANEPHRASGQLAYHILDAMLAFEESSTQNEFIELSSKIYRPEAWIS
jgi:predicted dehydrogenase